MKELFARFLDLFSDAERPDEAHYDPVHVGGMIVLVIFGMSALFWLLWALLVFGGGIQAKIVPLLQVIFTSKTAANFGYEGYPYAMGVFEGWVTNLVALAFLVLVIVAGWYVYNKNVSK